MARRFYYKSKHFFFVLTKITLVVLAIYFIYQKLSKNPDLEFSEFYHTLIKSKAFSIKTVSFLMILSGFNWFFEIVKWQQLITSVKKISFKNSLEQCLGSLTVSLLTPNRIGEYGAKALYFMAPLRKRVMFVNLITNLLQLLVTLVFGVIGLYFLSQHQNLNVTILRFLEFSFIAGLLGILILLFIRKTRFRIGGISLQKLKIKASQFPKKDLAFGAVFSLVRYLFFSFQFYYLLILFGIDIGYLEAMKLITSMYLLASIIPTIFLFDVIVKGSIAIYLFSLIGIDELVVLSVVTCMWILNFVIPSLIGSFYVLSFKLPTNDNA